MRLLVAERMPLGSSAAMACLLALFLSACANFRPHYSKAVQDWAQARPDPEVPLAHSVYLIGDAGYADSAGTTPALRLLGRQLRREGPNSTVLFLGDNLYPNGLAPRAEEAQRDLDEHRLDAQLDILRGYPGRVYFTPGNHDWYGYGVDGLKRQRRYLDRALEKMGLEQDDFWLPDPGCAGPEEVDLTDDLVLVFIDSQWWLQDWKGEANINEDCEVKSREVFRTYFEEAIKGNRSKNIVVVMHHPPFSAGPHGGQFTARQHLFPLTELNDNLYIPLPIIGSLYPFLRANMGSVQDVAHPKYTELRDIMVAAARRNGQFIFVAGHEHSLQYLEREEQAFVVSGAGSKRSATRLSNHAQFAYGAYGYSRLDIYEDGSVWLTFWAVDKEAPEGRVVFRRQVREPIARLTGPADQTFPLYESGQDSVVMALGEYDFDRSGLGRILWGDHYRDAYLTEISIPVLDLATFQGGVVPIKPGGGYQTNSLRLEDARGRQYNMRSIDKDPTRMVAYPLNESDVVLNIIKDSFSGAHPMAATPLPGLQQELGLYHTRPKVYYVPRQPGLDDYNDAFGDALYLVEERPDDDVWQDYAPFGSPEELLSTTDMIEEVLDEHDHYIDRDWTLRARLFDITIGDWDRHDDQWRWGAFEQGDSVVYRPVPRDRDQAMSKYDGWLFRLARETVPAARPLQPFPGHIKRIWWSNFGSRFFDATMFSPMEWDDWQREVRFIQDHLSDEAIERAFRQAWPEAIYQLDGERIVQTIQTRRDTLMDLARRFYLKHAREVDVVGTNQRDLFELERLNDQETRVRVFDTNREGERQALLFDRTFRRDETRELRLYGLQDNDIFHLTGEVDKGIRVRLIGGLDEDTFIDESRVKGWSKKTQVYDMSTELNAVKLGTEARERFSDDPTYNIYNRLGAEQNFPWWLFTPAVAFNPDDGLLLGGSAVLTTYGFKKMPHASKHSLAARFALATAGFEALYQGEFIDLIGTWEFRLGARYRSPLYATNFYGIGNESVNTENDNGNDYHRVRRREIALAPALMKIINTATRFAIGPTFESIRVERTAGRFIDELAGGEDSPLDEAFFEGQTFGGVRLTFDFENLDDPVFPVQGMTAHLDAGYKNHLNSNKSSFYYIDADVSGYQPLDLTRRLVLTSRLGVAHRIGSGYEFYQAARLGGTGQDANLRGFRRDRFAGKTAFFQNTDLRWHVLQSGNRLLPFSMGLYAGFDYGRVWTPEEDSSRWHYGYGGGLFLQPLDMINAQLNAFRGDSGEWRLVFMGTFLF